MRAGKATGPGRPTGPSGQPTRATGLAAVRAHNLSVVLNEIRAEPTSTRARIASGVGLTRATVSDLVDQLCRAGLVAETEHEPTSGAGRPGMRLRVAPGHFAALGLSVQVDTMAAVALDLSGEVLAERVEEADLRASDPERTLARLAGLTAPMRRELGESGVRLTGASLSIPGLVSDGRWVHLAPNLGWSDVDAAAVLAERLGLEVGVHNDADAAAREEMRVREAAGMGERATNLFYVAGEVGIGGALVVDGSIVRGQHGWGGELGHTTVDATGPRCACGASGCLEVYAGRLALLRGAGLDWDASLQALVDRVHAGDGRAATAVAKAGRALGFAVCNLLNVVDVGSVVLGGIYAPLFDELGPMLGDAVSRHVLAARWREVSVERALAGPGASVRGAALNSLDRLVADPTPWLSPPSGAQLG